MIMTSLLKNPGAAIAILLSMATVAGAFGQSKIGASRSHGFRSIRIETQPSATVFIDGVRFGKTGQDGVLEIKTIATGSHLVKLRADGFGEQTVPLPATRKGSLKVTLKKTNDQAELTFQEAERLSLVDRDKAIAAYKKTIKLRPSMVDAYIALARNFTEAGDYDSAAKAIADVRKVTPGLAEASAVEGRIFKESGYEDKAIASFKRAITEGRGVQPEAYAGLGLLYKEKAEGSGGAGDFEQESANYAESLKYLEKSIKQLSGAPDSMVMYQLVGLIYEREERFDEAIALYQEFLQIFPDTPEATAVRSFITQIKKRQIDR